MRDAVLAKLREIEELLAEATCDGEALEGAVEEELASTLSAFEQAVDYYVD